MGVVNALKKFSDGLYKVCEVAIVIMLGAMVAIITAQIICRLWFDALTWSEEAARYLLVWSTFLGASCVYKQGGHIAINLLHNALPKKVRTGLQVLIQLLCIMIFAFVVFYGIKYFGMQGSQVSVALRIPMRYMYLAIPISSGLMIVHGLNEIAQLLSGGKEAAQV